MRKDGARFPVLIIEAPLINAAGQQTGWMSAILDVSEQRRVEELSRTSQDRLQATARLATVGEMASLLSHELNQPLAAISSYATGSDNLLQDALQADPIYADLRTALRRIAEQAERAGKVIKSVHDFVRRRDQAREATAPADLLGAVMPLVALQARKLGVEVHTRIEQCLPLVQCDRTMVEQVLLNLARNGMQAMHDGKAAAARWPRGSIDSGNRTGREQRLLLQIKQGVPNVVGAWVEFSVHDRGMGIAPEIAQQLFTPFFHHQVRGHGPGLVAVSHRGRATRRRAYV